jgi:glycosyltransferase involved in cell wall biosynthesis
MGAAGRKRAVEHFAWDAIAQQTRGIYDSVRG